MSELFIRIFNMSISAGFLILAVVLARLALKKAPRWTVCLLWAIAAVRLMLPFLPESGVSLIPSAQTIPKDFTVSQQPRIDSGIWFVNDAVDTVLDEYFAPAQQVSGEAPSADTEAVITEKEPAGGNTAASAPRMIMTLSIVWLSGLALMLVYAAVSYARLWMRVRASVLLQGERGVFASDEVASPFILGLIRPRIYIPSSIAGGALSAVLAHERAHIKRLDHIWKPIGFLLLSVHWFNPLVWLAYALLCRDIETACDEKVVRDMDEAARAEYSQTLLDFSARRSAVAACPLAFGEVGVKERVKKVLNYRKPAFWIIISAVIICAAAAVCFLTNPKKEVSEKVTCYLMNADEDAPERIIPIDRNDEEFIRGLLKDEKWFENEQPVPFPYCFSADGAAYFYSPYDRMFSDGNSQMCRTVNYAQWERLNSILGLETDIPLSVPGAEGFSNDENVRVGVAQLELSGHNAVIAVWDNMGGEPFEFGCRHCLYKKNRAGDYEKVSAREGAAFGDIGCALPPDSFMTMRYSLEMYGDIYPGEYRLYLNGLEPTDYWIDFEIVDEARLARLREEYPEYFGLTGNVLKVYAMNPGRGTYILTQPGSSGEDGAENEIFSKLLGRGVCADDMRLILSQYGTSQMFEIVPVRNPLSSTFFVYETAIARFRMELNGTEEYTPEEAAVRLEELRQEYPEYFGVRTGKGLEVYVCQFGPGSFEFILLSGTNFNREFAAGEYIMRYANYAHVRSFADMKLILSTYDIDDDAIRVIYFQHPLSSYIPDTQRGYIPAVRSLLGLSPIE